MDEYISNSHRARDGEPAELIQEKHIESAVTGKAVIQKQTGFGKFMRSMVAEDAANIGSYILFDVLIPECKKTIVDVITMLLYGRTQNKSSSGLTKISYGNYYSGSRFATEDYSNVSSIHSIGVTDYDSVVFDNRGDAEVTLTTLDEIMEQYGVVSVGDMYEASGIKSYPYTVNKYGWTNIRSAQVVRCRDGYTIKMPKPSPIN